ncbi:hypothetical protein, partial [Caulobacter sp. S45]|uniref:hypothetical protein n=1 Tax=Caulobacter sp. S45 TaxID=1641861 RepID=UPI0015759D70
MSLAPVMLERDRLNWRSLITHARCAAEMVKVNRSAKAFQIIAKVCWSAVTPTQVKEERLAFAQLIAFGKCWPAMNPLTRAANAPQVRQLADRCAV